MPIKNEIDHHQKCIYSICTGVMCTDDFDEYLADIWTNSSHFGYNEFFDTTEADWSQYDVMSLMSIAQKATQLTAIDANSKLAWLVSDEKVKQLTDEYKATKSLMNVQSRKLQAFFSREEALLWLGID